MKSSRLLLVLACAALAVTPVYAAGAAAKKQGLQLVDSAWSKAMLANDVDAIAALYADDAVLVIPGSGAIKGRKAIRDAYAGWLSTAKVTDVAVTDSHYESSGNISTGWGAWKMTTVPKAGGAPTTQTGTWSAVAVKKNGVWKYVSDHASADPEPAPAK